MKNAFEHTEGKYAIIGAGPSGLAAAKCLLDQGIDFVGFEAWDTVGGLWNIRNPESTVYHSAHLISSKRLTEFEIYPMSDDVADYPHHLECQKYFEDFADHFDLRNHFCFNTRIAKAEPQGDNWYVETEDGRSGIFKGVIIANGTLYKPNIPQFEGSFDGEIMHSSKYKSGDLFDGKRVLIIGAGNSACDIAVDAVHRAKSVEMSVRRGYHFVPKYILGKPADTMGDNNPLPPFIKKRLDRLVVRALMGKPEDFGFPVPDHELYESHPIVNSLVLHHIGHGDIRIRKNIERLDGKLVFFEDGTAGEYDIILLGTGYRPDFPFINHKHLNWGSKCPQLYLNVFHPSYNNLFVIGLVEATGLGWQGRYEQAELVAKFIKKSEEKASSAQRFSENKSKDMPDLSGGFNYMKVDRMAYYVNKKAYKKLIKQALQAL